MKTLLLPQHNRRLRMKTTRVEVFLNMIKSWKKRELLIRERRPKEIRGEDGMRKRWRGRLIMNFV